MRLYVRARDADWGESNIAQALVTGELICETESG